MPLSFDKHEEGCRPLAPCRNCEVVAFLKTKLSSTDLETLDSMLSSNIAARLPEDTRVRDNPQFEWSNRTSNALVNDDIVTIADLVRRTEAELLRIPNFGRISLTEVKRELARAGWKLGDLPPV